MIYSITQQIFQYSDDNFIELQLGFFLSLLHNEGNVLRNSQYLKIHHVKGNIPMQYTAQSHHNRQLDARRREYGAVLCTLILVNTEHDIASIQSEGKILAGSDAINCNAASRRLLRNLRQTVGASVRLPRIVYPEA